MYLFSLKKRHVVMGSINRESRISLDITFEQVNQTLLVLRSAFRGHRSEEIIDLCLISGR